MYRLERQSAALHGQVELLLELLRASSMPYKQFNQQAGQLEQLIQQLHAAQKLEQQFKQIMWRTTSFYQAPAPESFFSTGGGTGGAAVDLLASELRPSLPAGARPTADLRR